ncbi:MAG TPA: hypothetical protein VGE72_08940 [Azospirillum sp.]
MALLGRPYDRLHLTVNEAKSAVASVFGRKVLGHAVWAGPKGVIKRRGADKAIQAFKDHVRALSPRVTGRSLAAVVARLRVFLLGWKAYSGWRKRQGSGGRWTNGYATGCEPSSSSNGNARRRSFAN